MTEAERDLLLLLAKALVIMDGPGQVSNEDWERFREGLRTMTGIVEGR